jgi:hypothetical protein
MNAFKKASPALVGVVSTGVVSNKFTCSDTGNCFVIRFLDGIKFQIKHYLIPTNSIFDMHYPGRAYTICVIVDRIRNLISNH